MCAALANAASVAEPSPTMASIATFGVSHRGCASGAAAVFCRRHRRQRAVVDDDKFGGVLGGSQGLGNDQRDCLAHISDPADGRGIWSGTAIGEPSVLASVMSGGLRDAGACVIARMPSAR